MIKLLDGGAYLVRGEQVIADDHEAQAKLTAAAGVCLPGKKQLRIQLHTEF